VNENRSKDKVLLELNIEENDINSMGKFFERGFNNLENLEDLTINLRDISFYKYKYFLIMRKIILQFKYV
jgi:hypothetical protein